MPRGVSATPLSISAKTETVVHRSRVTYSGRKTDEFQKDLEGESMLAHDGWMVATLGEAISAQVVGQGSVESAAWLVGALGGFVKRRDRSGLEIEPWYAGRGLHIRRGMIIISFEIIDLI